MMLLELLPPLDGGDLVAKIITKRDARRRVEEIHSKVNLLMTNGYITTKQFIEALSIVEKMRREIEKKKIKKQKM